MTFNGAAAGRTVSGGHAASRFPVCGTVILGVEVIVSAQGAGALGRRVKLRLITWNLHGLPPPARFGLGDSLARVAEETCRRAPDVLLFQEVWRRSYTARIIGHCQTAGYTPVLAQQGGRPTGGLVTLYHSATWSLGPVMFSPFRRHGSALRVWEGDGISRKGALATVLTNNRNMTSVVVVNTHLQAQYGKRTYAVIRRGQVAELESFVVPLTGRGHLMLLAGDFNTTPSDVLYAVLLERWTDLTADFRQVCETEGRTGCGTCFDGKTSQKWIDYVFVRRPGPRSVTAEVELIRNKRRDDPYSDHEGVQVNISSESRPS